MKNIKSIYDIEKDIADQDRHKKTKLLKKRQYVECAKKYFNVGLSKTIEKSKM